MVLLRVIADCCACCRLSSAAGIDLQATAQWCEKALPYLGILLIVFVRQHIVGERSGLHPGITLHIHM